MARTERPKALLMRSVGMCWFPALRSEKPVLLWPFDGSLHDLLTPGNTVIVDTYPADGYGWFLKGALLRGKGKVDARSTAELGTILKRHSRPCPSPCHRWRIPQ
jgi:hypothetical protein